MVFDEVEQLGNNLPYDFNSMEWGDNDVKNVQTATKKSQCDKCTENAT